MLTTSALFSQEVVHVHGFFEAVLLTGVAAVVCRSPSPLDTDRKLPGWPSFKAAHRAHQVVSKYCRLPPFRHNRPLKFGFTAIFASIFGLL